MHPVWPDMSPALETTRHFVGNDIIFGGGNESRKSSFQAGIRCEWDVSSSKWVDCFPPHEAMRIICRKKDCFAAVYPLPVAGATAVAANPGTHESPVLHAVVSAPEGHSVTGGEMFVVLVAFLCWAATCVAIGMVDTQNGRLLYSICKQHRATHYQSHQKHKIVRVIL